MRYLSLFSGIGGMDLGLDWAGWECVGQVENDKFCQQVLKKHWPTVPKWGDIQSVETQSLPECDAIVGGFPCQDISVAGKGAGLSGSRSGLWWEMHRIIADVRPALVLIENVPALRTKGSDTVFGAMEALDYTGEAYVVGAEDVGQTHKRKRVFYVAYSNSKHGGAGRLEGGSTLVVTKPQQSQFRSVGVACNANGPRLERRWAPHFSSTNGKNLPQYDWERPHPVECRMGITANGLPLRLAQRGVGNAVVPQVAYCLGVAINEVFACK